MRDTDMYEEFLFFVEDILDELSDEYEKFDEREITEKELQKRFKKKIDALIFKSKAFRECLKEADAKEADAE